MQYLNARLYTRPVCQSWDLRALATAHISSHAPARILLDSSARSLHGTLPRPLEFSYTPSHARILVHSLADARSLHRTLASSYNPPTEPAHFIVDSLHRARSHPHTLPRPLPSS